MMCKEEARMRATIAIAELVGRDYFKTHVEDACEAYPCEDCDDLEYDYFMGFEGDDETDLWTVFARVSVNRETSEVILLDYKTPDGKRMENPIKPVWHA